MSGAPDNKIDFDNFKISMLPDGTILQFPKDTPPEVQERVFAEHLGQWQKNQGPKPPQVGTAKAAAIGGTQGLTFNLGDEIAAGIGATIGRPGGGDIAGDTWGQRYDNALNEARGVQHAAQDQHPVAFGAGKVAGAALPMAVAPEAFGANWVGAAPTLGQAAARGAAVSLPYGMVTGFNEGEGGTGNRAVEAGKGGIISAAAGGIVAPLARLGANAINRLLNGAPEPSVPASQLAREAGNAAYEGVDQAGVILRPEAVQRLNQQVQEHMGNWGLDDILQPGATRAVERLNQLAGGGENTTLRGIEILRRIAGRVFNPQNPSDREAAGQVIDHIDDFMHSLGPDDIVQGNADDAVRLLDEARANWGAFRKAEMIEDAIVRAQDRAATSGTGGNVVNAIRQNLRKILDSPRMSRGFTEEELQQIRQVSRGGAVENIARLASTFAPSRGGLNAWLAVLSQSIPGLGQAMPVIGEAAHQTAQRMTLNAANQLPEMIRMGVPGAVARAPQLPPYSEAVARALGVGMPAAGTTANAWADALLRPRGAQQ